MDKLLSKEYLKNNQKTKQGGARPGSGRKKGATQKISGITILEEIKKVTGKKFETSLAEHYLRAQNECDWMAVRDYEKMFLNKVVAEKNELDVTSGGEPLKAVFNFPSTELSDWK